MTGKLTVCEVHQESGKVYETNARNEDREKIRIALWWCDQVGEATQ